MDTPTDSIKPIDERRMPDLDEPPVILSLYQCKRLLRAVLAKDKCLVPYVALGLFAGLRPQREAAKLAKGDIREELIHVRGLHAKDRQRRYVPVHPTLKLWRDLGGEFQPKNLRRRFEKVREIAGLIRREKVLGRERKQVIATGWEQDCLRHTFASHYLPVFGAEKTIEALGHGDYDTLFQHYRTLVTPREAGAYWDELTPTIVCSAMIDDLGDAPTLAIAGRN